MDYNNENFEIIKEIDENKTFQVNLKIYNKYRENIDIIRKILNINSPALNKENHINYYFFTKKNIKVISSDINDDVEIYTNLLCFLPSPQFPLKIELNFDTKDIRNNFI